METKNFTMYDIYVKTASYINIKQLLLFFNHFWFQVKYCKVTKKCR